MRKVMMIGLRNKKSGKERRMKIHGKAATGCGSPWGCEMSRLPHFLDNRLTSGAVRLSALSTGQPFTPRKIPATHFC
jgi:hypothetical protein